MARKRKSTEQPAVPLEELPRGTEELTGEEAEAAKGGWFSLSMGYVRAAQIAEAQEADDIIHVFGPAPDEDK
jgi:hypothetical protein